ncbi:uncharacterized protein N7459_004535 [Penicillium hispanicum]|uniref:uncharacterized protein n=1 Tax=Penicillium hispanicum TaxID=1080232 RepID=UPI002541B653|nr:uncharacterized protein N7459_004535 [Penicillium hispanicum]KAJ5584735.1 hypothetical protein N7459_004535 [Penicillium hispanicum]
MHLKTLLLAPFVVYAAASSSGLGPGTKFPEYNPLVVLVANAATKDCHLEICSPQCNGTSGAIGVYNHPVCEHGPKKYNTQSGIQTATICKDYQVSMKYEGAEDEIGIVDFTARAQKRRDELDGSWSAKVGIVVGQSWAGFNGTRWYP